MKQYVKDGKLYNQPIRIELENGTVRLTTDENIILANGYTEYVYTPITKTINQLIAESDEIINKKTDKKILNQFKFNGQQFYLTIENQTNFANMFVARDHLTFPQMVKTKNGFYEITDKAECEHFYLAGINFVKECLEEGWRQKAAAAKKIKSNVVTE